ncbi:F-box protein SKIP23-like [Prunus yedoensis var. nudiflora]|uniref:F-box protein SKIP23-like n=1 Tax=Prunus yedoensis var. nudiflora TaxID=2094558 RepID=A0A314YE44_PRUYE|nr:F-box protein SKIP23-like [Prunus yedoensis var. nudiflora]
MANWSNLPRDLVAAIAQKMVLIEDFIAIGAVCKSWNLALTKKDFNITDQVPFLMLQDKGTGGGVNDFFSLKKGQLIDNLNLPEEAKDKWCFASLGWLLVQCEQDLKVNLLHPLNHALVELPHTVKSEHINFKGEEVCLVSKPFLFIGLCGHGALWFK